MKMIKIGIIGAGQIAYSHCEEILRHPQAEVIAIADPHEKRREEFKQQFNLPRDYSSADELLRDQSIDAVSIAVPNVYHAEIAVAALLSGKHILLEKPMAINASEAQKIIAAAKSSKRIFMLGMNQRFTEEAQIIKTMADRGDLGEIYNAKAFWLRRSGIPVLGTWFGNKQKAGGGALLDIGVHLLDLCLYILDNFEPLAVSGSVYTKFGNRGLGEGSWGMSDREEDIFDVDDFATAFIRFKNGCTLSLDVSWASHQHDISSRNILLFGTKAGAGVFPPEIYRDGKEKGEYEVVSPQNIRVPYPHDSRFANWIDSILQKDKPVVTMEEALVVQKILDAIYESSRMGKEIRLDLKS